MQTPELNRPYIAEMARAEMVGRYGSEAYTEGYKVITTVRSDLQNAASQSVRDGLIDYDQRPWATAAGDRLPGQTRRLAQAPGPAAQRRRPGAGDRHPGVEKSGIMVEAAHEKRLGNWDKTVTVGDELANTQI